jgi:hypothetical protein
LRFIDAPPEVITAQAGERNFQLANPAVLRSGSLHKEMDAPHRPDDSPSAGKLVAEITKLLRLA